MSARRRYLNNNRAEQEAREREDEEKKKASDQLFLSLQRHIIRQREREKQMEEAESAKKAQLRRKEEDKKTLENTEEEIKKVEKQLTELKDKKQQLFLQLKALITKEVRLENDQAMNIRNEQQSQYMQYGKVNDKAGTKRSRSPTQGDYYKHSTAQGVHYMPTKDQQRSVVPPPDTGRAVLWHNPAKYGQPQANQWPMQNMYRYPMQQVPQSQPQTVVQKRHILIGEHQQQSQPPQLVKTSTAPQQNVQKSGGAAISIEKINDPMRPKIAQPQQDFTIHRRINPPQGVPGQPNQPGEFPGQFHVRYE